MKRNVMICISVLLCAVLCAAFAGCKKEPEQQRLSAPQNLRVERRILYFDAVEGAVGYTVRFGGTEHQVEEPEFSLRCYFGKVSEKIYVTARSADGARNSEPAEYRVELTAVLEAGVDKDGYTYRFIPELEGYEVGRGSANLAGDVVLRDYYGDYPVKAIAPKFFPGSGTKCFVAHNLTDLSYYNVTTTSVTLPRYLEQIGDCAFEKVLNLERITIPESVQTISYHAFRCCQNLKEVELPSGLKRIEKEAFMDAGLHSIDLPEGLEYIGDSAFRLTFDRNYGEKFRVDNRISCVRIPSSLRYLKNLAFANLPCLFELEFLANDLEVYEPAFRSTPWLRNKPEGIVMTGNYVYRYKGQIRDEVFALPACTGYASEAFGKQEKIKKVILPEGCELWGEYLFHFCAMLEEVNLPADMTDIPAYFLQGTSIKSITLPAGATQIGDCAFANTQLRQIEIPNGVRRIGHSAFANCTQLQSISLPESVEVIAAGCFSRCKALEEILLPGGLKNIYGGTFEECTALKRVVFKGGVEKLPMALFKDCGEGTEVIVPASVARIERDAFAEGMKVYFEGNADEWKRISQISSDSAELQIFFYSATAPQEPGRYWHYEGGDPAVWE